MMNEKNNQVYKEGRTHGFLEDACGGKRRHMQMFLWEMRKASIVEQLFSRRSQPIRFGEKSIEGIIGIDIHDALISQMVQHFYQSLIKDIEESFEAHGSMLYVVEESKVALDNGEVRKMKVPRKIDHHCYSFAFFRRPSDLKVKRLIRWTDQQTRIQPYVVDSISRKGAKIDTHFFDSECGLLARSYYRYLKMQQLRDDAIEKRAQAKPWIQHMSALQTQKPQEAVLHAPSYPGLTDKGKKADAIHKKDVVILPFQHVMCSHQPLPAMDIDMKEEEDRFTTEAGKLLKLASWETYDYAKAQYKNELQVAHENSQQRTVVLERYDDISSAIATIFYVCFGVYEIQKDLPMRADYDTLIKMYKDGTISEDVVKKGILDTHALDEKDVMPESMREHREILLESHRYKDMPSHAFPEVNVPSKKRKKKSEESKKKKTKTQNNNNS